MDIKKPVYPRFLSSRPKQNQIKKEKVGTLRQKLQLNLKEAVFELQKLGFGQQNKKNQSSKWKIFEKKSQTTSASTGKKPVVSVQKGKSGFKEAKSGNQIST